MQKIILTTLLLQAVGGASASTTHTMTNGSFDFYDATGTFASESSHNNVVGAFDLVNGTGQLTSPTFFSGTTWVADVAEMDHWGGVPDSGEVENHSFSWATETWFIGGTTTTCRVTVNIDSCVDENASGGLLIGTTTDSYNFTLNEGQFAAGLFFDWSTSADIPILSVWNIVSTDMDGSLTVESVDSDGDGTPGTAMMSGPYPGQTLAISGVLSPVPVPAAVQLFGSGLIALIGVSRRKKV